VNLPHYETIGALVADCEKYPDDQRCGDRYTVGPLKAQYQLESWTSDGPKFRRIYPDDPEGQRESWLDGAEQALTTPARAATLPTDSAARKEIPIAEGVLFYFPAAIAEVARISRIGNDKHNPGEPLHHARGKSMDHEDCIVRHTLDARESAGAVRTEHLANRAWRALAALQEHCETAGAPLAPNARLPEDSEC